MNKPQALNLFLFLGSDGTRTLGTVETPPILRVLRPATFALWFVVFLIQALAVVTTGETGSLLVLGLCTLLFIGIHLQFWYEESERGRRLHHALERIRGRVYEDEDTGLPNSRHFVFELRRQMMRSVRNGRGFSLVLTDVVGIEQVKNAEQRVLMSAGRNIRQALGDGDFVARLEGPVFAAIVLDERELSASEKAEGLVAAVGAAIPNDRAASLTPIVSVSGYEGEIEVRDFLRRCQRDLQNARLRATGPLYDDPDRLLRATAA